MYNISILNKNNCTGCRMCEQICPVKAVKMIENKEGFIEPFIDNEKCINCGLCAKRCPQLNRVENDRLENIEVYAAKNKNVDEQKESSSGGIFSILAQYVLENSGIVYGCAFNEEIVAEHIGIKSKEDLAKLRGSKYVQSNTKHTFQEVKKYLEEGKLVLYSGTPCQIAGLKAFLGKEYKKLLTVDLVCHGVPSPKLFNKYIKWLEEKNKSKVKKYEFRNKEKNGWGLTAKVTFENGKVKYINSNLDPYYKTFLESKTYRECCYNCEYANVNRIGDITLADYWGIEKEHPDFLDEKGVSAVIINTKLGKRYFQYVEHKIDYIDTDINKVKAQNLNLQKPVNRLKIRDKIYYDLSNKKFEKYVNENLKYKPNLKDIIKNKIPAKIKKRIKKILKK